MKLIDIFERQIDREIEGVIKAGDRERLLTEVDEFVITTELKSELSELFEAYNEKDTHNGAWISGFFGSGKSHLLKMLALLLKNEEIDGKSILDRFLPKCQDDALLQGAMKKAASIPSQSILFNIDQKADVIKKTDTDAVLGVFVKTFNEACGYYHKQGYIAQMERHLDEEGLLDRFKEMFEEKTGRSWEIGRERVKRYESDIDEIYGQVTNQTVRGVVGHYRDDYAMSIEDFADLIHDYIEKKGPQFRLNFFVDEVGQYVAGYTKLMTNLQTIAEALNTKCRGRAWLLVTAQEEMETVLGELGGQQTEDFSKIQDRFSVRVKLTSNNVEEVIHERLLRKKPDKKNIFENLYDREFNNFKTMFSFMGGKRSYPNFKDKNHFVQSYPFVPYQYDLFQAAIRNLSKQNAFEGKHQSVGERSMLAVFQDVLKGMKDQSIEDLATFDRMFEGIRSVLKAAHQNSILIAERNLNDELAIRILKALFLVKYVKEFRADLYNISILMTGSFTENVSERNKRIQEALNLLENESFIQRNGDVYEYLTDQEKDIEREIKNTDIEQLDIKKFLGELVFDGILRDRKLRYEPTGQNFPVFMKVDDTPYSREYELAIHLISPFHELHGKLETLHLRNMQATEMLVILPDNDRLMKDLIQYKKTEKYIHQNTVADNTVAVQHILQTKGKYNQELKAKLLDDLRDMITGSTVMISGDIAEHLPTDPQAKIVDAFAVLVKKVYTNLSLLGDVAYSQNMIDSILDRSENAVISASGGILAPAEDEMLSQIGLLERNGTRLTVKRLLDEFERRPYGWSRDAILCVLANLTARSKVAILSDSNELTGNELAAALKNSRQHEHLIIRKEQAYSRDDFQFLKQLYQELFNKPPKERDTKELVVETKDALETLGKELESLLREEQSFPFLKALEAVVTDISDTAKKPNSYFFKQLKQDKDALLDKKTKLIDPMQGFMAGSMRDIYLNAKQFLQVQQLNLKELGSPQTAELESILNDPDCYKGQGMQKAKALTEDLARSVNDAVKKQRDASAALIQLLAERIRKLPSYAQLEDDKKQQVEDEIKEWDAQLYKESLIPVIRDKASQVENRLYPALIDQIENLAKQDGKPQTVSEPKQPIPTVSMRSIHIPFERPFLETGEDVERFVDELKKNLKQEIQNGKRIQI